MKSSAFAFFLIIMAVIDLSQMPIAYTQEQSNKTEQPKKTSDTMLDLATSVRAINKKLLDVSQAYSKADPHENDTLNHIWERGHDAEDYIGALCTLFFIHENMVDSVDKRFVTKVVKDQ